MTTGGKLQAKFVIHTVGPVFRENDPEMPVLLGNCYRNALRIAVENGLRSVAFPNISTGIYRYPKKEACAVALDAVRAFLSAHPDALDEIRFVCFDEENYNLYLEKLAAA